VAGANLSADDAVETEAAVAAAGGAFRLRAADIAATAAHPALVETSWSAFGRLGCTVNNAGVGAMARGDLLDVMEASFDGCTRVNTRGALLPAQAVADTWLARRPFTRSTLVAREKRDFSARRAVVRAAEVRLR
jgi:NAD(P)-dependent dehydrogenase (short-subunit alcohol dehydrogenase family)